MGMSFHSRRDSRPPRPAPVTEPTEITVHSNLYKYKGEDRPLHQYTVTMVPEVKRSVAFQKFKRICEHNNFTQKVAYDGSSTLISSTRFDDTTLEFPLREGVMTCKIEFRNTVKMSESLPDFLTCMNILIKHH